MEDIYKEIFDIEYGQSFSLTRDVVRKYNKSKESFSEVGDQKEKDFLQAFTFIAMLCFDVYMKKTMIEKIIDDNFSLSSIMKAETADEEKKAKPDKKNKK